MNGVKINGHATVNGVNTERVGRLIAGMEADDATDNEKMIAARVGRRVEKMHRRGYTMQTTAKAAHDLVIAEALRLN